MPSGGGAAVRVVNSSKDELRAEGRTIVIVSYDLATRRASELEAARFGMVVADESHCLKSADSNRSKALLPLVRKAKRALLLSGTPLPSRPAEIFTQANALRPKCFAKRKDFEVRYCAAYKDRFGTPARVELVIS